MRRSLARVLALALAACVPASERHPPAGAAGFSLEPSAAARGEPFEDGEWTVTVERLVLRVTVSADTSEGGSQDYYLVDASKPAEIFTSGVPVGETRLHAYVGGRYVNRGKRDDLDATVLGAVDPAIVERFENPSPPTVQDRFSRDSASFYQGPSILLVVRGERAGASPVVLDVAFRSSFFAASSCYYGAGSGATTSKGKDVTVAVRADDLVLTALDVLPVALFDTNLPFSAVAAADANHDGLVDENELAATPLRANALPDTCADTMLIALGNRVGTTVVTPR